MVQNILLWIINKTVNTLMLLCADDASLDSKLKKMNTQILIKSLCMIRSRPQSAQNDDSLSEFTNPAFDALTLPVDQVHSSHILTVSCVSLWGGGPADCWTLWDSCTADRSPWKQSMFVLLAGGVTGRCQCSSEKGPALVSPKLSVFTKCSIL